jgi:hypothetical protein
METSNEKIIRKNPYVDDFYVITNFCTREQNEETWAYKRMLAEKILGVPLSSNAKCSLGKYYDLKDIGPAFMYSKEKEHRDIMIEYILKGWDIEEIEYYRSLKEFKRLAKIFVPVYKHEDPDYLMLVICIDGLCLKKKSVNLEKVNIYGKPKEEGRV